MITHHVPGLKSSLEGLMYLCKCMYVTHISTGLDGMPTASSRRMRHALQLAHKLGDRERELLSVRRQLKEAREKVDKYEKKNHELEKVLENATQPGRYVL